MKKVFTYCFDNWWRPILFWVIAFGLVIISEIIKVGDFGYVSYGLLAIALLGLIISGIYQLKKPNQNFDHEKRKIIIKIFGLGTAVILGDITSAPTHFYGTLKEFEKLVF